MELKESVYGGSDRRGGSCGLLLGNRSHKLQHQLLLFILDRVRVSIGGNQGIHLYTRLRCPLRDLSFLLSFLLYFRLGDDSLGRHSIDSKRFELHSRVAGSRAWVSNSQQGKLADKHHIRLRPILHH